jgi:hypothetical protein
MAMRSKEMKDASRITGSLMTMPVRGHRNPGLGALDGVEAGGSLFPSSCKAVPDTNIEDQTGQVSANEMKMGNLNEDSYLIHHHGVKQQHCHETVQLATA